MSHEIERVIAAYMESAKGDLAEALRLLAADALALEYDQSKGYVRRGGT